MRNDQFEATRFSAVSSDAGIGLDTRTSSTESENACSGATKSIQVQAARDRYSLQAVSRAGISMLPPQGTVSETGMGKRPALWSSKDLMDTF